MPNNRMETDALPRAAHPGRSFTVLVDCAANEWPALLRRSTASSQVLPSTLGRGWISFTAGLDHVPNDFASCSHLSIARCPDS